MNNNKSEKSFGNGFICSNCGRQFSVPVCSFENHGTEDGGYYELFLSCPHCLAPDMFRKADKS